MFRKLLLPFLFTAIFTCQAIAQTGSISGKVTNNNGEPVPTANVLLTEINQGTATNLPGEYSIENVEPGTYTLRVTFVGYKDFTTQITINPGQNLEKNITLVQGAIGLEELVVTGFGKESKIEYTGSASTVDVSTQIENVPVTNVGKALMGSVTGLNVRANSGTPGSPISFNIRGVSSINAGQQPLIVLDGIPVTKGTSQFGISSSQGLLSSINPQDIASITVLKGPVATAQYGAEGANGVIVITTKRGIEGEAKYNASYQRGVVSRATPYPDMATAEEIAMLYREAIINKAKINGDPVPDPSTISIPGWDGQSNTNWADILTNDNPVTQQFSISASGGSPTATYYGSLAYQNSESVIISSGYERFSGTFNFGYNFNDRVNITNQFTGSFSTLNGVREGAAYFANPESAPLFIPSTARAYNDDGSFNLDVIGQYNPLAIADMNISRTRNYRLVNSTKVNIDLMDNLTFHTELGIDYSALLEKTYGNPEYGWSADLIGFARDGYNRVFNGSLQTGLNYIWTINDDMSLDTRLVGTARLYKFRQIVAAGKGFATLGLHNLASASTPLTATSFTNDGALLSVLAKAHYSYKEKLFLDGTIRREGNSRFAPNFRWGTFYGIGAGWLVSAEDFLSNSNVFDLLKIRGSIGVGGNNKIGRNEYQSFLGFGANYNEHGGINPVQLGNLQLTWEKKRSMELGLSFGLFNRVDGDVTLFRYKTYDLLYNVPLSRTTGFSSQLTNVGELENKGLEVSLDVDVLRTQDLLVNLSGKFTYVTNEVTELAEDANGDPLTLSRSYKQFAVLGHTVGEWYMKTYAGVNATNGFPLWEVNGEPDQADIDAGNVFKLDRFGDTWLTSTFSLANPAYQGASSEPTHYGSIGLTINYKGLYAGATLFGSFGNKIFDVWGYYYQADGAFYVPGYTNAATQLKRWQKPGDITDVPRRIAGGNHQSNARHSTRFLYDGSFLRLQTLRLGYQIPVSLLSDLNIGLRGLNVYLIGRNLWTYAYDEDLIWDPQIDNGGFLDLYNQAQKSFNIGIEVEF